MRTAQDEARELGRDAWEDFNRIRILFTCPVTRKSWTVGPEDYHIIQTSSREVGCVYVEITCFCGCNHNYPLP